MPQTLHTGTLQPTRIEIRPRLSNVACRGNDKEFGGPSSNPIPDASIKGAIVNKKNDINVHANRRPSESDRMGVGKLNVHRRMQGAGTHAGRVLAAVDECAHAWITCVIVREFA